MTDIPTSRHSASLGPAPIMRAPGLIVDGLNMNIPARNLEVFDTLCFSVVGGAITCLLGESGIGKSLLLKALVDILPQSVVTHPAPRACIRGEDGGDVVSRAAYMAQDDLLLPWLTVLENTNLGNRLRGTQGQSARNAAEEILAQMGLSGVQDQRPEALSGGMRQRVALARTLLEDRPFVAMDEPFSKLDAITRRRLHELTATFMRGRTVLMVTHDPLEALTLADHVLVMAGRPARIIDRIDLAGPSPRSPADPAIVPLHKRILGSLEGGTSDAT